MIASLQLNQSSRHLPSRRLEEVLPARHCGGSRCPPLVSPPLLPYWPFHPIWHRLRTNTGVGGAVSGRVRVVTA